MNDDDDPETGAGTESGGPLGHADPLRESGDLEVDIPLHAIDPCDFNPKSRICGPYRRGLSGSLGVFGLRDRLKVWPNPRSPGRYVVLDGNQRLDVVKEKVEDHLASIEAESRLTAELAAESAALTTPDAPWSPPEPPARLKRLKKAFAAVKADEAFMAGARALANSQAIPCRVLVDLPPEDARLLVATWDRNKARFDEVKLADLAASIQSRSRELIERIARPERVLIAPLTVPAPASVQPQPQSPAPAVAAESGPTEEKPWGDPPPIPEDDPGAKPATSWQSGPLAGPRPAMVPKMFQFTPEGAAELDDGLLKTSARIVRCERLKSAVERFHASSPDADLSDLAAEVALICMNRRIEIAAAEDA